VANKQLFGSTGGKNAATAVNNAGGQAYQMSDEQALAQIALTGMLTNTYYVKAEDQLKAVLKLAQKVDPAYLAKLAVYARTKGFMKDMPALLMAVLSTRGVPGIFNKAFPAALENGKMVKNFVQIIRSGAVGRKSLGSGPKRNVGNFLNGRGLDNLLWDSISGSVTLAGLIKLAHPNPNSIERAEVYKYLSGKPAYTKEHMTGKTIEELSRCKDGYIFDKLPEVYQHYIKWSKDSSMPMPKVPFQMLTSQHLTEEQWRQLARNASWQEIRQSLNMFQKHGVFNDAETVKILAEKLRNPELIAKAKVFPYQILVTYIQVGADIPGDIRNALHDAMELATANVPNYGVSVAICPDESGSMTWGGVGGSSVVKAVDVAALFTSVVLRNNPGSEIIPFQSHVLDLKKLNVIIDPRDTIMTNAKKLTSIAGGGTRCSAPLEYLNQKGAQHKLVVLFSDNESWVRAYNSGTRTEVMVEWDKYKARVPDAKLVCVDVQPNDTTQANDRKDVLNVGGFSDSVFEVINKFVNNELDGAHLVGEIKSLEL
jgi:60 kDa SS-A/Ro ribonucleoprotein